MTRVLVISHEYPPFGGGAGVVAQDMCRGLSKTMDITLVTNNGKVKVNELFDVVLVNTIPKIRFLNYWMAVKKLNLENFDKIILNDIGSALMASLFFNIQLMKKSIVYLHGSEPENIFVEPEFIFKLLSFKRKYSRLLNNCFSIVAVSDYMKSKFLKITKSHQLDEKINVINNGIDTDIFNYTKSNIRQLHNIPQRAKIVISVSRVVVGKGYPKMYDIMKQLIDKAPNVYWLIIGSGDFSKQLQDRVALDGMSNNIKLLGQVPRGDLKLFYSSADMFLLLSEFFESLGLAYLEANACGCPVIGNDKGGVSDIITNGRNGYKIPQLASDGYILDKIDKVLFQQTINEKNINEFSNKYSIESSIEQLRSLLLTLVPVNK
ncbi:MAG: glycosyltransferase involved in cell wall biosynthesis [Colwellia sp.]|jgi:glycosyltransferase involved in cell wall biosynthesis